MKSYVNLFSFGFLIFIASIWFFVRLNSNPQRDMKIKFMNQQYNYTSTFRIYKNDTLLKLSQKKEFASVLLTLFNLDTKYKITYFTDSTINATNNFILLKFHYQQRNDSLIFQELKFYTPNKDYCP